MLLYFIHFNDAFRAPDCFYINDDIILIFSEQITPIKLSKLFNTTSNSGKIKIFATLKTALKLRLKYLQCHAAFGASAFAKLDKPIYSSWMELYIGYLLGRDFSVQKDKNIKEHSF